MEPPVAISILRFALPGDVNGDGIVNSQDLAAASSAWLTTGPTGDVNARWYCQFAGSRVDFLAMAGDAPCYLDNASKYRDGPKPGSHDSRDGPQHGRPSADAISTTVVPAAVSETLPALSTSPTSAFATSGTSNVTPAAVVANVTGPVEPLLSISTPGAIQLPAVATTGPLPFERLASFISSATHSGAPDKSQR